MAAHTRTEHLRSVEAVAANYERLLSEARATSRDWERMFDAIEDPICVVTADYRLIYANAAYLRVFRRAARRDGQHYCFGVDSGGGSSAHATGPCAGCPLSETVRTRQAGFTQQVWRLPDTPDSVSESRTYQRWTYPIVNGDGMVDRVVEVIKDVTEQEQMRRTFTSTEALREADRLKAELLGTVSHELRSPLTAIKGYAATLLRHERRLARGERREFLEAIGAASDRLEILINRLLEMSQLETGSIVPQLAPVDVGQVAREAISAAEQKQARTTTNSYLFRLRLRSSNSPAESAIRVRFPVIVADARLLRDALDNLLDNAIKYSPAGGVIAVTIGTRAVSEIYDVSIMPSGEATVAEGAGPAGSAVRREMLEMVVRDSGVGIPAEHLGRVFERFHRVDARLTREIDGLGLGLAMCKRIAELHGGGIWAESAPGQGSAFHLLLPFVAPTTNTEMSTLSD